MSNVPLRIRIAAAVTAVVVVWLGYSAYQSRTPASPQRSASVASSTTAAPEPLTPAAVKIDQSWPPKNTSRFQDSETSKRMRDKLAPAATTTAPPPTTTELNTSRGSTTRPAPTTSSQRVPSATHSVPPTTSPAPPSAAPAPAAPDPTVSPAA